MLIAEMGSNRLYLLRVGNLHLVNHSAYIWSTVVHTSNRV